MFSKDSNNFDLYKQLTLILNYCRCPRPYLKRPESQSEQFADVHQLLFLAFFIEIIYMSFLGMFIDQEQLAHKANDVMATMGPIAFFILGVIVAPLMEELFFRLTLKYSKYAFTGILFALGFTAFAFIPEGNKTLTYLLLAVFIIGQLGSTLVFHSISRKDQGPELLKVIHRKYYGWLFYGQAIIFGLVHISNYNLAEMDAWYILPFLVVPQTMLGFILGYSRIKYGFWSNIYLHMVHNAVLITLTLAATRNLG